MNKVEKIVAGVATKGSRKTDILVVVTSDGSYPFRVDDDDKQSTLEALSNPEHWMFLCSTASDIGVPLNTVEVWESDGVVVELDDTNLYHPH